MKYGFLRVASATAQIRVADCLNNGKKITEIIKQAADNGASVVVLPELCISGYTCSDLFLQKSLLDACEKALEDILENTKNLDIVSVIGVPVAFREALYNCAAVCCKGKLLDLVPKINIPNYTEFYEQRHFTSGKDVFEKHFHNNKNTVYFTVFLR